MGEVYRARDSRLDRHVALKVLPSTLSANAQMRERFEREARAISTLTHPNICTLYDVGREGELDYLVMEYLEGESLADRLARGPLPLPQVLKYGMEIADALDRAHRQGVVHRDLKPGNVMITRAGAKLLDFGLAKYVAPPAEGATILTLQATAQQPLTEEGTVLGTFQYMAPEQIEGAAVDARADIFALGAILYEMATGRRAFDGKTRASIIAAILEREPAPVSSIQPLTPRALDRVIRLCLAKDPEERWQSARDVKLELQGIAESLSQPSEAAVVPRRRLSPWMMATAALALLLAGAIAWIALDRGARPTAPRRIQASILPPDDRPLFLEWEGTGDVTLSPDGRWLTFSVRGPNEDGILLLRALDSNQTRPISGLGQFMYPFWSPDSRSIGFFGDGKLKRLDVAGGPAVTICDAPLGRGASWSPSGVILFAPDWRTGIHRVDAAGGEPVAVTTIDPAKSTTHRYPWALPDGKHFLYLAGSHVVDPASHLNEIRIAAIDGSSDELLLRARSNAIHVPGWILFVREGFLLAQPFDDRARRITGDPIRIAEGIRYNPGFFHGAFAASQEGTLVYVEGGETGPFQLVTVDADGSNAVPLGEPASIGGARLSRDGSKLAIALDDPSDLWIHDLQRGLRTRLTTHPMNEYAPVFSPDGSVLLYTSDEVRDRIEIRRRPVDGSGAEEVVFGDGRSVFPSDWSADGRWLLIGIEKRASLPGQNSDFVVVPADAPGSPVMKLESQFALAGAVFSPDVRWIAFASNETGRHEIYVTPFPGPGARRRLSTDGARIPFPVWNDPGDAIFYVDPANRMMRIPVRGGDFGVPEPVFELDPRTVYSEPFPGNRRFFEIRRLEPEKPIPLTLVTGWQPR